MPTIIIRRFPLPSVSIYLILSASLLFLAVMWANNTLVEEQEFFDENKVKVEDTNKKFEEFESVNTISHEEPIQETKKKKVGKFKHGELFLYLI